MLHIHLFIHFSPRNEVCHFTAGETKSWGGWVALFKVPQQVPGGAGTHPPSAEAVPFGCIYTGLALGKHCSCAQGSDPHGSHPDCLLPSAFPWQRQPWGHVVRPVPMPGALVSLGQHLWPQRPCLGLQMPFGLFHVLDTLQWPPLCDMARGRGLLPG